MKRIVTVVLGFGVAVGLLNCGDGPTGDQSTPGRLELRVTTSASGVGIMRLVVSGGAIDSVTAPGFRVYRSQAPGTQTRLLVVGSVHSGVVGYAWVPDTRTNYSAVVDEVAASGTYSLLNAGQFTVTLAPPSGN